MEDGRAVYRQAVDGVWLEGGMYLFYFERRWLIGPTPGTGASFMYVADTAQCPTEVAGAWQAYSAASGAWVAVALTIDEIVPKEPTQQDLVAAAAAAAAKAVMDGMAPQQNQNMMAEMMAMKANQDSEAAKLRLMHEDQARRMQVEREEQERSMKALMANSQQALTDATRMQQQQLAAMQASIEQQQQVLRDESAEKQKQAAAEQLKIAENMKKQQEEMQAQAQQQAAAVDVDALKRKEEEIKKEAEEERRALQRRMDEQRSKAESEVMSAQANAERMQKEIERVRTQLLAQEDRARKQQEDYAAQMNKFKEQQAVDVKLAADGAAQAQKADKSEVDEVRKQMEKQAEDRIAGMQREAEQAKKELMQQREADRLRMEQQTAEMDSLRGKASAEGAAQLEAAKKERAELEVERQKQQAAQGDMMGRLAAMESEAAEARAQAKRSEKERKETIEKLQSEQKMRKKYLNELEELKGTIRVLCRVRPISKSEIKRGNETCVTITDPGAPGCLALKIAGGGGKSKRGGDVTKTFEFDAVFGETNGTQEAVFEVVQPLVQQAVDGFNVCIFAYGQTGSGKTFTMGMSEDMADKIESPMEGITPRMIRELFLIKERETGHLSLDVEVSMLQLYHDGLEDLLLPEQEGGAPKTPLPLVVHKDPSTGVVRVDNAVMVKCNSVPEVLTMMSRGAARRATSATNMNAESSRSHLVCCIYLRSTNLHLPPSQRLEAVGKLTLVDLAGSERLGKSGVTGSGAKEAVSINKSLSALGDVIGALTSGAKHIPYRNHLLTQVKLPA
jgi:hypothetical protein